MALMHDLRFALLPRKGSIRIVLFRMAALVLSLAPGFFAARSAVRTVVGEDPRVAALPDPLPFHVVQRVIESLGGAPLALLGAGILVFFVWDQVITAGALLILDPNSHEPRPRVWRTFFDEASAHFWPFVRIACVALALAVVIALVSGRIGDALLVRAEREGWTGDARYFVLPLWRATLLSIALGGVGALSLFARVLTVVDERRRVRRTLVEALRILVRAPIRAIVVVVVVTFAAQMASTALVVRTLIHGDAPVAFIGGALLLALHMGVWHFLLRYARNVVDDDRFDDLRARGDAPLGVYGFVKRVVFRRA